MSEHLAEAQRLIEQMQRDCDKMQDDVNFVLRCIRWTLAILILQLMFLVAVSPILVNR